MISVREYAAGRGISPQAVFQKLERMGLKPVRDGRRSYLPDEVRFALDQSYENPPPRKPRRNRVSELEQKVADLERRIEELEQKAGV